MGRKSLVFLYPAPLCIFLLIWHIASAHSPENRFIFSSPELVARALVDGIFGGDLLFHSAITAMEALSGFILGTSMGAVLGLSLWYFHIVARISHPYIVAIGAIPIIALAPVTIVWFGIGIFSKIMMATFSTLVVALVQAYEGATKVESRHVRLMKIMGASRFQVFQKIVIPSALVWVVNSMKLNIGMALLGAFIGEFISAENGLGYVIVKSSGLFEMAWVFAACAMLTVVALLFSGGVTLLERRLVWWLKV